MVLRAKNPGFLRFLGVFLMFLCIFIAFLGVGRYIYLYEIRYSIGWA